jgi:dienelactone hydrolase
VLLHSCLGLPSNRRAIGEAIAGWGYVALFVDDFAPRGLKETCSVDFAEALSDAYGALAFVGRRPDVDPSRVAVVGFSQGADTALQIATGRPAAAFGKPDRLRFKAVAAFYPPCANQADAMLRLPTLILVGSADQVTPAADCERLASRQSAGARLIVYPGAGHVFDDPQFAQGKRVLGMWLEYDRKAADRSLAALRNFLATALAD